MAAPSGAEGGVCAMNVLSTVPLQVGEVYKRLRSQVRGSQSRQHRCLRSELKAVLVPCIFEHTLKLYIISQLCGDVVCVQIKSTGNRSARTQVTGRILH